MLLLLIYEDKDDDTDTHDDDDDNDKLDSTQLFCKSNHLQSLAAVSLHDYSSIE